MSCKWCGCNTTDGLDHGTQKGCIEALQRELQRLHRQLLMRQSSGHAPTSTDVNKPSRARSK